MNRKVFVVSLLGLGGLVAAAEVRSTLAEQQQRLRDFRAKAQEARKAQKLDGNREALVSKYPTPEIGFIEPMEARGGSEMTLAANGRYVPGSLVVVPCEGVEVLSTKVTAERAEARVRIRPNAMPAECDLQVVSPVSAISRSKEALRIRADSVWELKLSNGMTTRWTVEGKGGPTLTGRSEWFAKGKPLGARAIVIERSGDEARVAVEASEEETQASVKAAEGSTAGMEALGKKMEALFKKMDAECSKLTPEKRAACNEKYGAELEAINAQFAAGAEQVQEAMNVPSTLCKTLTLKAVDGKVTGTGSDCAGESEVQVSGTYKPAPGK